MIDAAPSLMWKSLIQLAVTSGLRKSELPHLRWTDFDSDAGAVRVEEHHSGRYVVSGRDVPILPWQPKTKRSTRTVPIPPATVDQLQRLKVRCGGGPYLFVDLDRLSAIDTRIKAGKPAGEMVINFSMIFNEIQALFSTAVEKIERQ